MTRGDGTTRRQKAAEGQGGPAPAATIGRKAVRRRVQVLNERGLHARVAARIAATAERFDAEVRVRCKGHDVSALSIMGLLMLAAQAGTRLELVATGADAAAAADALVALFKAGFEET